MDPLSKKVLGFELLAALALSLLHLAASALFAYSSTNPAITLETFFYPNFLLAIWLTIFLVALFIFKFPELSRAQKNKLYQEKYQHFFFYLLFTSIFFTLVMFLNLFIIAFSAAFIDRALIWEALMNWFQRIFS